MVVNAQPWLCCLRMQAQLQARQKLRLTTTACAAAARSEDYDTLAATHDSVLIEKKSRFHAYASPCASAAEALAFVASHRDSSARHHCRLTDAVPTFAAQMMVSLVGRLARPYSAPWSTLVWILLLCSSFDTLAACCSARGVCQVRAYGSAAALVLSSAPRIRLKHRVFATAHFLFKDSGAVRNVLDRAGAQTLAEDFDTEGCSCTLRLSVNAVGAPALSAALADTTSGRVRLVIQADTS